MKQNLFLAALFSTLTAVSFAYAQEATISVPGQANIFGAGLSTPPGGGSTPPFFFFAPKKGRVLTIQSTTGQVRCSPEGVYAGADGYSGGYCGSSTTIASPGPISSVSGPGTMFLLGVFTSDNPSGDTTPDKLEFTDDGDTDFKKISPKLNQTFFIGDGHRGVDEQRFNVPATATRFYMGFADAYSFNGPPGYYEDNEGSIAVAFEISEGLQIKGTILDELGEPINSIKVTAAGPKTLSTKTNTTTGDYAINVPPAQKGSYNVTPSAKGFEFKPKSKRVNLKSGSVTADFTALCGEDKPRSGVYRGKRPNDEFYVKYQCGVDVAQIVWTGPAVIPCEGGVNGTGNLSLSVTRTKSVKFGSGKKYGNISDSNYTSLDGYQIFGQFTARNKIAMRFSWHGPIGANLKCTYEVTDTLNLVDE